MQRYNPKDIEPKWQQAWEDQQIYQVPADAGTSGKPKKYILEYFPYPSGAAMHVGHVRNYTIGDALARYNRMAGHDVLHPMGWDGFGLPAENYAIKNGVSPRQAIDANTARFKQQLTQMGFSYDWSREIDSTDPKYYRWTQWFFLLLFKRGLAYQRESLQWWCPVDKTVLANEQVEAGLCWRCGNPVEKKALKQWFFKITDYADRLAKDLDDVDWSDSIKTMQRNWIGRSKGAEIDFPVDNDERYVLLHGFQGSPAGNFFPWLRQSLSAGGQDVQVPDLPNSDNPTVQEQVAYVQEQCRFDDKTVLLGHSLGAAVALEVAESLQTPIKRLVLVAGFAQAGFDDHPRPFEQSFDWQFDFKKIKANVGEVIILRAKNDSAVPADRADYLAEKLGGRIVDFTAEADHVCGQQEPMVLEQIAPHIKVFTTRPDTLYGATFMVLAPEHPLVEKITTDEQKAAVQAYIKQTQAKTDIQRQETDREKTGVFTGAYAVNPANGETIPVWIADYVLYGYGTGAIMAVPAHDERDYAFAQKFDLPIKQVVASYEIHKGAQAPREQVETVRRRTIDAIIRDENGRYLLQSEGDQTHFVGGGIDDEDVSDEDAVRREVLEETGYTDIASIRQVAPYVAGIAYRHTKEKNQQAWGAFYEVVLASSQQVSSEADQGMHTLDWVVEEDVEKRITWSWHVDGWRHYKSALPASYQAGEGVLINSGPYDWLSSSEAREKIVADLAAKGAAKEVVNYKLRDWLISRQRYWGAPIPIIHCPQHGAVPVPEEQLPVKLPEITSYEPSGDGRSPLANVTEWVNTSCPTCGGPAQRETDTMDGFACSSWYFLRFADPHNDQAPFDPAKVKFWLPVDDYIGGAEHAVMHLLYARFWTKVMYDDGLIDFQEPFTTLRNQGLIMAPDGTKMSKSKGNTIEPDFLIDQGYGADAIRIMELFIGPWNQMANWSVEGLGGSYRFLQRVWTLVQEYLEYQAAGEAASEPAAGATGTSGSEDAAAAEALLRAVHRTIKKADEDLRTLSFNTSVAALMELVNELYKLKAAGGYAAAEWRLVLDSLLQLLAPFAPHITEELWHQLGHDSSIHLSAWPRYDERYLVADTVTVVVQVNGKLRAQLSLPPGSDQAAAEAAARAEANVAAHLDGKQVVKTIFVPDKLVNFVAA